jgi:hypothetical protein
MNIFCRSRALYLSAFLALTMLSACAAPQASAPDGTASVYGQQGIKGTLVFEGEPVTDAYVYAYRTYSTNLLGPADFASNSSGPDGAYTVDLVKGSYYIMARKRASGDNTGPIVAGDLYSLHSDNPVSIKDGVYTTLDLELVQMRDPMFFQAASREESKTGITGQIVDKDGNPVPWVFAMAYTTNDMKRVPEYTSVMTAADGKFVIYLPRGGRFWVSARKNIREKPVEGEPYGLYAGAPDHSVTVLEGRFTEGISIELQEYHKGIQD